MIPGDILAAVIYVGLAALIIVGLASAASVIIVRALVWIDDRDRRHDAQAAADHGEPTREQVEAEWWPWMDERDEVYGPRAMWGPTDAEADREWAEILAVVDLTPDEVQARYEAAHLADRMDKIRADIACNQFRRELEDFDGGVA